MTNSEKPFAGKRALVTGAARGIGHAIAEDLAQWGADIAIYRPPAWAAHLDETGLAKER